MRQSVLFHPIQPVLGGLVVFLECEKVACPSLSSIRHFIPVYTRWQGDLSSCPYRSSELSSLPSSLYSPEQKLAPVTHTKSGGPGDRAATAAVQLNNTNSTTDSIVGYS